MTSRENKRVRRRLFIIGAIAVATVLWVLWGAIQVQPWTSPPFPKSWAMREARSVQRFITAKHMGVELRHAAIVGEDTGFFMHHGIDFIAVSEAIAQYTKGRHLRGASTITQQLAKNLFLGPERSLCRKTSEARLALWLEVFLNKHQILSRYLNVIEFGPKLYGVQAAALHYYGVQPSALSREQAAGLAACIPSPKRHNPKTQTKAWFRRRAIILERMEATEHLRDYFE